jgi:hypothetical protein
MESSVLLMSAAHLADRAVRCAVRGASELPIRASLRRFREAIGKAEISIWPVTVRLDQPAPERPEPRIKAGYLVVERPEP